MAAQLFDIPSVHAQMPGLALGQGGWQSNAELPWEICGRVLQAEIGSENEPALHTLEVTVAKMPK